MIVFDAPLPLAGADQVRGLVLDWAGTTVDFGSRAPVAAMQAAFEQAGVPVSEAETRRPMGKAKREHLAAMLSDPAVSSRWRAGKGREWSEQDLDQIYREFLGLQAHTVAEYSGVIEGCVEAIAECRRRGVKIGSSTGYTRELLDKVAERAAREGYQPDVMLSADDISPGRPAPWLCFENARRMGIYPMAAIVKVDDTPAGVAAGRNAGAWSVGVVVSGNEVGLSREALAALSSDEQQARFEAAGQTLQQAGAHMLIDTIAELPAAIDHVNALLKQGKLP
jgi:phosphonoacetaldehyde hydrolase